MAVHVSTCPHCHSKKIALSALFLMPLDDSEGYAFLLCPNCRMPSCCHVVGTGRQDCNFSHFGKINDSFELHHYIVREMWPAPVEANFPEHLPSAVLRSMEQAETNFRLKGHEEAAGVMYRKALELGLRQVDSNLTGMLASRIEQLGKAGKLTLDLVSWAKEIKNLGNEGAHEEEPLDREELEALRGLTDMVLRYLFTLPEIVRLRRTKTNPKVAP